MRKSFRTIAWSMLCLIACGTYIGSSLPAFADSTGKVQSDANSVDSDADSNASNLTAEPILHPLDPLTKSELAESVLILKESGKFGKNVSMVSLTLVEPEKKLVLNFKSGDPIDRKSIAVLYGMDNNETHEVVTDLNSRKIVCDTLRKNIQPMLAVMLSPKFWKKPCWSNTTFNMT